jgi:hypothetical protein
MSDDFSGHPGSHDSAGGHLGESLNATRWPDANIQLPDGSSGGAGKRNSFPSESRNVAKYIGYVLMLIFLYIAHKIIVFECPEAFFSAA